jgi:hypothetical protein
MSVDATQIHSTALERDEALRLVGGTSQGNLTRGDGRCPPCARPSTHWWPVLSAEPSADEYLPGGADPGAR